MHKHVSQALQHWIQVHSRMHEYIFEFFYCFHIFSLLCLKFWMCYTASSLHMSRCRLTTISAYIRIKYFIFIESNFYQADFACYQSLLFCSDHKIIFASTTNSFTHDFGTQTHTHTNASFVYELWISCSQILLLFISKWLRWLRF